MLYKMHGDVRNPSDAVLTKDAYETYASKRPLFRSALQGELVIEVRKIKVFFLRNLPHHGKIVSDKWIDE